MKNAWTLLAVGFACLACADGDKAGPAQTGESFDAPQGIAVMAGRVFVTNTASHWDSEAGREVYGPGTLTVLNGDGLDVADIVGLDCTNPQYVLPAGDELAVVCSGGSETTDGLLVPVSAGEVVWLDPATLAETGRAALPFGTPHALAGFPGSAAWDAAHERLYIGSGTGPYVFVVARDDAEPVAVRHLHDDLTRNDLVVPVMAGDTPAATSFLTGSVHLLDPDTGTPTGETVDITPTNELEGPVDARWHEGFLYVLLTHSSRVMAVDLAAGTADVLCTTGNAPNRLAFAGDRVFVVNSLDNNLTAHDLATGHTTQSFAIFPPATNPWELAVDGDQGLVTGYLSNTVLAVDLASGEVVGTTY